MGRQAHRAALRGRGRRLRSDGERTRSVPQLRLSPALRGRHHRRRRPPRRQRTAGRRAPQQAVRQGASRLSEDGGDVSARLKHRQPYRHLAGRVPPGVARGQRHRRVRAAVGRPRRAACRRNNQQHVGKGADGDRRRRGERMAQPCREGHPHRPGTQLESRAERAFHARNGQTEIAGRAEPHADTAQEGGRRTGSLVA